MNKNDIQKSEYLPSQVEVHAFSGPLPPPSVLAGYDQIKPGLADRIVRMAEEQSAHRRELEKAVVRSNVRNSTIGMVFALVVSLGAMTSSVFMVSMGCSGEGVAVALFALASLVAVFIYGKKQQHKELAEKRSNPS